MADLDSVACQSRNEISDEFDRVAVDGRRRQAIAYHHRNFTCAAAMVFQQALRLRFEQAPEVGTPEIIAAGFRPAGKLHRRQAALAQAEYQRRGIESSMNGI